MQVEFAFIHKYIHCPLLDFITVTYEFILETEKLSICYIHFLIQLHI